MVVVAAMILVRSALGLVDVWPAVGMSVRELVAVTMQFAAERRVTGGELCAHRRPA